MPRYSTSFTTYGNIPTQNVSMEDFDLLPTVEEGMNSLNNFVKARNVNHSAVELHVMVWRLYIVKNASSLSASRVREYKVDPGMRIIHMPPPTTA
jgi:hypothetical protein